MCRCANREKEAKKKKGKGEDDSPDGSGGDDDENGDEATEDAPENVVWMTGRCPLYLCVICYKALQSSPLHHLLVCSINMYIAALLTW